MNSVPWVFREVSKKPLKTAENIAGVSSEKVDFDAFASRQIVVKNSQLG